MGAEQLAKPKLSRHPPKTRLPVSLSLRARWILRIHMLEFRQLRKLDDVFASSFTLPSFGSWNVFHAASSTLHRDKRHFEFRTFICVI